VDKDLIIQECLHLEEAIREIIIITLIVDHLLQELDIVEVGQITLAHLHPIQRIKFMLQDLEEEQLKVI